jgi:hypothetical protein
MTTCGHSWRQRTAVANLNWPLAHAGLLLVVLLLLLPPDSVLTDNEENYFQLAAQAITGVPASPDSAVFDASRHRFFSELLLGRLISLSGFEGAQVITRVLTAVAFALLLPPVFRLLSLSALDGVIVVVVFALLGQNVIGAEWLFHGFEAKVVAYGFVLAALHAASTRRSLITATSLCVAATYFHFLVGAFWFLAVLGLRLIENRREIVRIAVAAVVFMVATAPLAGTIFRTRLSADSVGAVADAPAPDVIYSLIREPWHGAPFMSWSYFAMQWLPGYLLAGAMLAGCIVIARTSSEGRQCKIAVWLAVLISYLFIVLLPTFVERHTGVAGKFYPFRPSSLVLLLWLALALAWLNELGMPHFLAVKLLALALITPAFLNAAVSRIVGDVEYRVAFATDKQAVATYLAVSAASDAIVLVDPTVEALFLDFERRTGRPSLVAWKFAPTNDLQLREWYRRIEFRKSLFENGCPPDLAYRVDFLLTTPRSVAALSPSCGLAALETEHWRLLRRAAYSE